MNEQPNYAGLRILFTAFSVEEGSEEMAGYEFITKYGANDVSTLYWGDETYAAKIPSSITKIQIAGNNDFDPELTKGYDLIFRHQTTRPDMLRSPTTTNTNEFFKYCTNEIIAVTGTKGKGTTSTLISEILDEAGVANRLLGNMGNTAIAQLDAIEEDEIVVFEISSFQLWDLEYSPHVAVVLMMGVDHQDVHNSIEEYIQAKASIVRHQNPNDIAIHHPDNPMTAQVVGEAIAQTKKYMTPDGAHIEDNKIMIDGAEIMWVEHVGLHGKHNLENVCAAITAAWEYTQDTGAISTAVAEFGGLEHRLEKVAEKQGFEFFDDSFSATPVATIAAVRAFDRPISLIVGGYDKGLPFEDMVQAIVESSAVRVVAIGTTREIIAQQLEAAGFDNVSRHETSDMHSIVGDAIQGIPQNSIVLLSPGCASFDMFKNYKDRGNQFKTAVAQL